MVRVEVFVGVGGVERGLLQRVAEDPSEDEEVVVVLRDLDQRSRHRQQQPQPQQRATVAEEWMAEEAAYGGNAHHDAMK